MTVFFLLLLILSEVLLPNYTCASRVRRQNAKVRISAIGNTIMLKFLQEDMDTKLEGYILGYGSSMFSRQFLQLPENGEPYETEIDAEPKYLIAVQPIKERKIKKQCADKETLQNPLHLVIGSVSPTSVVLSWSAILNNPYTDTNVDDCIEDRQYTVRYREKEPDTNWLYQTCPTTTTVIDQLKPDTPYEFGVRAETETVSRNWSAPVTHNTADTREPLLPYLRPITEGPQAPFPSLPNVHEPVLPYQEPITEEPLAPIPSLPNVHEPVPPYLEPITEEPQAPIPSLPNVHEPVLPYLEPITEEPQAPIPSLPNVHEPVLPYLEPIAEEPQAPIPSLPNVLEPLLPYLEPITEEPQAPVPSLPNIREPLQPFLDPITEGPPAPVPSLPILHSVTQSRPPAFLRHTAPPPIPRMSPGTGSDAIATSSHSEDPFFLTQTSSFTHTPVNLPPPKTTSVSQPKSYTTSFLTSTNQQQLHTPQSQLITSTDKIILSKVTDQLNVTSQLFSTSNLQTVSTKTKSQPKKTKSQPKTPKPKTRVPRPNTAQIQDKKSIHQSKKKQPKHTTPHPHTMKSQSTTTQTQVHTSQSSPHITHSQSTTTQSQSHTTQSPQHITHSQTTTTQSQAHTTKSPTHITQPQPYTAQLTTHITQSQITTTQSQAYSTQSQITTTQSQAYPTQSPQNKTQRQPTTTHSQPHTTQSHAHITQPQQTTTHSQPHTTQSPPHITQAQPHTAQSTTHITQSQITTTQSQAYTTQSPSHVTQSHPHTTQSQPKYQPKKTRPREHKNQSQPTKRIQQPNTKLRTPQPHKPQSRPITSHMLPNTTISQPSTVKYQSRTVQPRPGTTQSQFTTTQSQASTAQKSNKYRTKTEQKSSTAQPLTSTIYRHVPTQHKPINKQTNFTLSQSLPIKGQPSKKQQPTLSYQEPVIQHNQALTSPNTLQITSVQKASVTSIPEADVQEDRASLHATDQHPTAAKVIIIPIRSQDGYVLSTTEIDTKTRRVEPVSATKYQPAPTQHQHPTQATIRNPHTTPWKSDKTEFTTISEPQTTNGSYSATKHNVHKPSSKYNDNKHVPLAEKKVVREKLPGRKPAPSQSQDGQRPKPALVNGVKKGNKGRANSSSSVARPSATTVIQAPRDEKHKGLLQPVPTKEPSQKLELQGNIRPPVLWKKSKKVEKQSDKDEENVINEVLKPQAAPTTKKPVYEQPEPTTTPFFAINGSRFDTGDNSSVFSSVPVSTVDVKGRKRYIAPHVFYKTDKHPDEPCSVTQSLSYFPEEESLAINVTGPPKTPPTNLSVVTVEGCPSFVILDWEKGDNETTEYEVTSSITGANGEEVSVITTNQTHTAVENLKPESSYEFRVTPKNELGSGPASEPVSFSTESADPRVSEIPTGKNAIWSSFPFKADSYSECTGTMYVKRTWYRKFVGIQLCNSLRYKIYLSDSLKGKFYSIGDQTGYGEDHCQFVDSFLDGRTGGPLPPHQLPPKQGFYRSVRQEPVKFGIIGGNTQINYVAWYECGVPIPGSW